MYQITSFLLFPTLLLLCLPVNSSGCTACGFRSRYSCNDGCYWINKRCRGTPNCNNGDNVVKEECRPGFCDGSPNTTLCDLDDDEDVNSAMIGIMCSMKSIPGACDWNNTTKKCELDPDSCKPLLIGPLEEGQCKSLGCNWTINEDCGSSAASSSVISLFISTMVLLAIALTTSMI